MKSRGSESTPRVRNWTLAIFTIRWSNLPRLHRSRGSPIGPNLLHSNAPPRQTQVGFDAPASSTGRTSSSSGVRRSALAAPLKLASVSATYCNLRHGQVHSDGPPAWSYESDPGTPLWRLHRLWLRPHRLRRRLSARSPHNHLRACYFAQPRGCLASKLTDSNDERPCLALGETLVLPRDRTQV